MASHCPGVVVWDDDEDAGKRFAVLQSFSFPSSPTFIPNDYTKEVVATTMDHTVPSSERCQLELASPRYDDTATCADASEVVKLSKII